MADTGFAGRCATSPNGRYVIGWMQFGAEKARGEYLLAEDGAVVVNGTMPRPHLGAVADDGTFVVVDQGADLLRTTVHAFDRTGAPLLKQAMHANISAAGLSPDGGFAVCQTLGGDHADGNKLHMFDVRGGSKLLRFQAATIQPDRFDWDVSKRRLVAVFEGERQGRFTYTFDGEFLDQAAWQMEWLRTASTDELFRGVKERLQSKAPLPAAEAEVLSQYLGKRAGSHEEEPVARAMALRLQGELAEATGNRGEALAKYEAAMAMSPKAGVKGRIAALRKTLGPR